MRLGDLLLGCSLLGGVFLIPTLGRPIEVALRQGYLLKALHAPNND